ncbi:MAG: hypothetical protein F4029_12245 [Gammaproteobacteria bacterium]|nr:hypothetical protein [Gammaproteobacteria bacterium]MYF28058.1 hypothetical protein [Gammaproteobacteria bacterium]MYK46985.1 hypothetical protein [Gammaproteobacteria bacterium]
MTIARLPNPSAALAELARLTLSAGIAANPTARACSERLAGRSLAIETLEARFVIHFEAGAVRVDSGTDPADATVRGSPGAVAATLAGGEDTAAILGDAALFEDFRDSFRPRLDMPGRFVFEDIGDIVRLGAKAAESALEGLANALRNRRDP